MGDTENPANLPETDQPDPHGSPGSEPAPSVELLADLQAGLLDDDTAARVRRQVRDDPDAQRVLQALHQVRRDVAAVGADPQSAPEPPATMTARIAGALRDDHAATAAHSARPGIRPAKIFAGLAGIGAALAAVAFGTAALLHEQPAAPSTPTTIEHITVSTPPMTIPLSAAEISGLLGRTPDYGPLSDASRRASCLAGLGYPAATPVLGARPVEINARPGVLLVLPADTPTDLAVFAVALNCSAADTGLLASTQIPRP
ncbi:hypothetical protein [Mycobacterium sherrisii]|uniref:Anti-sigma-M factor RsmA n=1 Tax=Mycobacterium sherrisii TaxID=243061 RepID=A0A1E3SR24_9MYCO|nr:hypothetical protein [Mycobacterium sherrisii]MCV7029383.1 hypothetical protein [Mycobacterium sherrisii]MEC4761523.1 hypothetical protein [Mycobacterium sherrisii]ODR04559.1 hypothetical protein BHQ21_17020 [Mycobacterium sherrisii]ORW82051.1 hypothetical protein AWC25_02810 [Mycobacterium sherrisii]